MADKKISALTSATTPLAGTEVLPIVQSSATVKVAVSDLTAGRTFDALGMTLTSTDAGASAAPTIDLYRNSASPAASDTIGEIEFNGKDSAGNKQQYALIHGSILSPTSTTEQGQIHFETATAGASTEKMIIGTTNLVINDIGAVFNVRIEGDTDANLFYTDATNDKVGIGTITPGGKLDVVRSSTATGAFDEPIIRAVNTGTATINQRVDIAMRWQDGVYNGIGGISLVRESSTARNGSLVLLPIDGGGSPVQAVVINSSGNVGINTTSMGRKLNIADATAAGIQLQSTGTGARNFSVFATDNNASVQSSFAIFDDTASAYRFTIDSSGIVTMPAYGVGTATFSAAGVISSVSDETWKIKDGVPTNPDAMLKKLEPGYWYYNDEKKETFGAERQLGFYAQNVNAAIGPEAAPEPETHTTKNDDGTKTIVTKPWGYYDRSVLAITVMSLQNALATIEALTARITALEKA